MKNTPTLNPPNRVRGFTLVELLVVISIIVILAGIAMPTATRALAHAERVEGMSDLRNVKSALDLFASDFEGEYPSDSTAAQIKELMRDDLPDGRLDSRKLDGGRKLQPGRLTASHNPEKRDQRTSNEYFQQLMGRGLDNEDLFHQKAFRRDFELTRTNSDAKVDRGENVWGYTKNLMKTSASHIPLVYDTPISTGDNPIFSKKSWDGRIMVSRLDGSTEAVFIAGSNRDQGPVRETIRGASINLFSSEALEEGELVPANLRSKGNNH